MAFSYMIRTHPYSVDHALKYEGYAFEPAEWESMTSVDDVFLGRKANGVKVYAAARLERQTVEDAETVTHEKVSGEVLKFSASGHTLDRFSRHSSEKWLGAGQMIDELLEITEPAPGWTLEEIRKFHRLWKNWHLNSMNGGCQHVPEPLWEDSNYGKRPDLVNTPACPETGYRYGHKWLLRPIPAVIVDEMQTLIRKLKASDSWRTM
jgi:hypothetical protein